MIHISERGSDYSDIGDKVVVVDYSDIGDKVVVVDD